MAGGYFCKMPSGWFFRENKKSNDFTGPFSSRAAAKIARDSKHGIFSEGN